MESRFAYQAEGVDYRLPVDILEPEDTQFSEIDLAGISGIPTDAIRVLLLFLLPEGSPRTPGYWKQVAARIAALAHALHLPIIGEISLTELAEAVGCTRSLLSLNACKLRDFAALDCQAGRTTLARESYAQRAREVWGKRRNGSSAS